jgi:hypothetical protein
VTEALRLRGGSFLVATVILERFLGAIFPFKDDFSADGFEKSHENHEEDTRVSCRRKIAAKTK